MAQKVTGEDGRIRFLLKVGDLADRRERKDGRWRIARSVGQKMLYVGCPYCNSIIELPTRVVNVSGIIRGNVTCPHCDSYASYILENWEEYLEDCKEKGENP